jgi:hypothetical protein
MNTENTNTAVTLDSAINATIEKVKEKTLVNTDRVRASEVGGDIVIKINGEMVTMDTLFPTKDNKAGNIGTRRLMPRTQMKDMFGLTQKEAKNLEWVANKKNKLATRKLVQELMDNDELKVNFIKRNDRNGQIDISFKPQQAPKGLSEKTFTVAQLAKMLGKTVDEVEAMVNS